MQVKDMMHQGAEYVAPNAKLQAIAKKMRDHDVGAIPVCEGGKTIGMVTDRDIAIRALANGKDVAALEAKDVMSKDVVFCRDTANAEDAIRIMEENRHPQTSRAQRGEDAGRHGKPRRHLACAVAGPYRRSDTRRLGAPSLNNKAE